MKKLFNLIFKVLMLPIFVIQSIIKRTKEAKTMRLNGFALAFFIVGSVISDIVEVVAEWAVAFWGLIIQSIESAIGLVYDPTGTSLAERITFIGYLALFGLAIGIVKLGMAFVMKFFKK